MQANNKPKITKIYSIMTYKNSTLNMEIKINKLLLSSSPSSKMELMTVFFLPSNKNHNMALKFLFINVLATQSKISPRLLMEIMSMTLIKNLLLKSTKLTLIVLCLIGNAVDIIQKKNSVKDPEISLSLLKKWLIKNSCACSVTLVSKHSSNNGNQPNPFVKTG